MLAFAELVACHPPFWFIIIIIIILYFTFYKFNIQKRKILSLVGGSMFVCFYGSLLPLLLVFSRLMQEVTKFLKHLSPVLLAAF